MDKKDKVTLIERYESWTHPCIHAEKSMTYGYPAVYWFCQHPNNKDNLCCLGGGHQKRVQQLVTKCPWSQSK